MGLVVPAVLASSRDDLRAKLKRFASIPAVTRIQIDVVDGKFASPQSWPYTAMKEFKAMQGAGEMLPYLDQIEYEIDLMCTDPGRAADAWLALGARRLTFHAEGILDLSKFLETMRLQYGDLSATFGMALNVGTPSSLVESVLEHIEYVQFMGIDSIGKQGQPFNRLVIDRLRAFHKSHPDIALQVDGGVSLRNANDLISAGVSSLIIGSALAGTSDLASEVQRYEALQAPFGI